MSTVTLKQLQKTGVSSDTLTLPDSFTDGKIGLDASGNITTVNADPFLVTTVFDGSTQSGATEVIFNLPSTAYNASTEVSHVRFIGSGLRNNQTTSGEYLLLYPQSNGQNKSGTYYSESVETYNNGTAYVRTSTNSNYWITLGNSNGVNFSGRDWVHLNFDLTINFNPQGTNSGGGVNGYIQNYGNDSSPSQTYQHGLAEFYGYSDGDSSGFDGIKFTWPGATDQFQTGQILAIYYPKVS